MSGDDSKLISVFADGRVWIAVDVIQKMLNSPNLVGQPPEHIILALHQTVRYIESQTIVSISDQMLDSMNEE